MNYRHELIAKQIVVSLGDGVVKFECNYNDSGLISGPGKGGRLSDAGAERRKFTRNKVPMVELTVDADSFSRYLDRAINDSQEWLKQADPSGFDYYKCGLVGSNYSSEMAREINSLIELYELVICLIAIEEEETPLDCLGSLPDAIINPDSIPLPDIAKPVAPARLSAARARAALSEYREERENLKTEIEKAVAKHYDGNFGVLIVTLNENECIIGISFDDSFTLLQLQQIFDCIGSTEESSDICMKFFDNEVYVTTRIGR